MSSSVVDPVSSGGIANRVILPLPGGRAGRRRGRRLAVVADRGRRSGRRSRLGTLSSRSGRTVRIRLGLAQQKTWWRTFPAPHTVRLRRAGEDHDATGRVTLDGDPVHVLAELEPDDATLGPASTTHLGQRRPVAQPSRGRHQSERGR